MSLIRNFWEYCQCYEIPRNYAIWSALGLMSASVHRRVYIMQGDITIHANMYICLVGEQGGRKSTPKDFARDIYSECFPTMPVAAAMQSREDIIKFLASDESLRTFKDEHGTPVEFHPYILFINELKNFLSFNAAGMIEFLTDIYDRKYFDASTIKRGLEKVVNPCISILACETPEWIIERLKTKTITGGFSRRMVYVYEIERKNSNEIPVIPRPVITPAAMAARQLVKDHLQAISEVSGRFKWTQEGGEYFDEWYRENKLSLPDDPVMRGYRKTKDVQLLKVCMLLALARPNPQLLMTPDILEEGLATLDGVELNMPKLSIAAGRNELAVPTQRLLEILDHNGGWMPENRLRIDMEKELNPMELLTVIRHLKETDRLFHEAVRFSSGTVRTMFITKSRYEEWKKNGEPAEESL